MSSPAPGSAAALKLSANLRVLQRLDPSTLDILVSASHVAMYNLTQGPTPTWEKKDVEGSLFVVKKAGRMFDLVVLNRNSPANFAHSLDSSVQVKVMEKLLMFKKGEAVHGLYFHDARERGEVKVIMEKVIRGQVDVEEKVSVNEAATASLMSALGINKGEEAPQSQGKRQQQHPAPPPAATTTTIAAAPTLVLDKKSLQLTLLSLIQDDRFLDIVHGQYLRVIAARKNGSGPGGGAK